MTDKVTSLTDRQGIPPKLHTASDALCEEVWSAIDKATDAGLPTSMIVGFLEMAKFELLAELTLAFEGEPA